MSMNWDFKNLHVANTWHSYLMQPGDGTLYRFGFCRYPIDWREAYTLDAGVTSDAWKQYIKFYINMTTTGMTVCNVHDVIFFPDRGMHVVEYVMNHGLEKCHYYTVVAVILALRVLWVNYDDIDNASSAMLEAAKIIKENRND